jgi:hypothetical protein
MQMAEHDKENRNLNAGREKRRRTPYDLRITGTFADRPERPPKKARPPTASEIRANNHAKKDLAEACGRIGDWAPVFREDLEEMNKRKVGVPFRFSDSMIWWILCVMTAVNTDFRFISGFLAGIFPSFGLESPSYSRLNERCNELTGRMLGKVEGTAGHYEDRVLAVHACGNVTGRVRRAGIDSSGINLSNTNLWRMRKWKTSPKYKGWMVLHALSDVDTGEILAYAVTNETVGDSPLLKVLVEAAKGRGHVFDTLYADAAYSSNENWVFLSRENNIRFVTSFKSNTRPKNNGCGARGDAARLWCSLPYDEWVKESGYGVRWKCECVFSDFKRIFPETVTASSEKGIIRQLFSRIEVFNRYKSVRAKIMGVTGNGVAVA